MQLLEAGKDEELIEKETGVSDRTIRRWKLELERFGRIGKPPESRTGRHRVMGPDVEQVTTCALLRPNDASAHTIFAAGPLRTCRPEARHVRR